MYTTRLLTPDTWDDFAALVEANNGVWGGCWCMGFHPEGVGQGRTVAGNRAAKRAHVAPGPFTRSWCTTGTYASGGASTGRPWSCPTSRTRRRTPRAVDPPAWRIGCIFTGEQAPRTGVARAAVAATLDAIKEAGGGIVEAYPEQVADRGPQRGAYFHTGPETLFEDFGFTRQRQIAKWRWVMRAEV